RPSPPPQWLTFVPSSRRPALVPDFARRLAEGLRIPFVDCIRKRRPNFPQKARQNNYQRVENLLGVFEVVRERLRPGPVLLVDDIVDSRWTLTVISMLLGQAGCEIVYPFALADASEDDSE